MRSRLGLLLLLLGLAEDAFVGLVLASLRVLSLRVLLLPLPDVLGVALVSICFTLSAHSSGYY